MNTPRTAIAAVAATDRVIRIARSFAYPNQIIYLIVSFLVLVSIVHFIALAQKYWRARNARSLSGWYYHVPLAVVDSFRAILFRWNFPVPFGYSLNIAEVALTFTYLGVLLTWTFVNTTTVSGIKVEPHYYANRAGTIAASQLPLVTALGMRNNLVSYLTGVSYDKLNYLHRIAFRSLIVLIWIHAGGRVTLGLLNDEALTSRWIQCGLLAAITLTIMSIITLRPLRKLNYEIFLVIHFVFALIFLLSVYFHLTGRDLAYYGAWPAMIVWGVDRFIRLLKLALLNLPSLFCRPLTASHPTNARIEIILGPSSSSSPNPNPNLNPEASFLKITVSVKPAFPRLGLIKWRPGQSAYLSIPSLTPYWPFQAHPFTIATISYSHPSGNTGFHSSIVFQDVEKFENGTPVVVGDVNGLSTTRTQSSGRNELAAGSDNLELVFFVRVRQGFTKRLFSAVQTSYLRTSGTLYTNVILNGPYSAPPLLVGYKRVVLIAGGSGIAFTLPLLLDLIAKSHDPKTTGCKRVLFIWAVKHRSQVSCITPILHTALSTGHSSTLEIDIDIRFHVTSSSSDLNPGSLTSSKSPDLGGETPPFRNDPCHTEEIHTLESLSSMYDTLNISTSQGRPDISKILDREINGFDAVNGPGQDMNNVSGQRYRDLDGGVVSVNVCGPVSLINATREALRTPRFMDIVKGAPRVVLHVEGFGGE